MIFGRLAVGLAALLAGCQIVPKAKYDEPIKIVRGVDALGFKYSLPVGSGGAYAPEGDVPKYIAELEDEIIFFRGQFAAGLSELNWNRAEFNTLGNSRFSFGISNLQYLPEEINEESTDNNS